MITGYITVIIALSWLTVATLIDIKTREIPDWLNYSLIAIALSVSIINSIIYSSYSYFLYSILGLLIGSVISLLMYYGKQWGGGDAKLLMGLSALLFSYPQSLLNTFNPNIKLPFLAILIINIILAGGLYSLITTIVLYYKNIKKTSKEFKKIKPKYKTFRNFSLATSVILVLLTFILQPTELKILLILLAALTFLLYYLYLCGKALEKVVMLKYLLVKNLTEGDWIAKNIFIKNKLIAGPSDLGITKKQIALLQKSKIKQVLVKEGIPFAPAFLIGTIVSLVLGNFWLII
ncbi:MAG: prepilin peptidase [Candidatus Woesearchaeota archaeon]|nr:MAG: prepilin peptidase [Candidatus Woesearchaeota archaeon]